MKITVIYGNTHHGSTWHCAEEILGAVARQETVEKTEFYLPKDMPHFCSGCFSCFYKGEGACPHAAAVGPIVKALMEADLIVLTSPVYAMDVTGHLKALLDHLCYFWLSHRPDARMFNKVGLVVSTTGGAGLKHTVKTMRNSLTFWGVRKTFVFQKRVAAKSWNEVKPGLRAKIAREAAALGEKLAKTVRNHGRLPKPPLRGILFRAMAGMQRKNDWNPVDRAHWEHNGWLSGKRPF